MRHPFVFGEPAKGVRFTGRSQLLKKLMYNMERMHNTLVLAPRGWGKNSLAIKAISSAQESDPNMWSFTIDFNQVKNRKNLADAIMGQLYLLPGIAHVATQINVSNDDYVIDLPEWLAIKCRIKFIIKIINFTFAACAGEFQTFQSYLFRQWSFHQSCSYIILGSFPPAPVQTLRVKYIAFPENTNVIILNRPDISTYIPFIQDRFRANGKRIDEQAAREIVRVADRIPFYCQLLASRCWYNTAKTCTTKVVKEETEQLVLQHSLIFQTITDNLTVMQYKLLMAVICEGYQPYSKTTIRKFDLQSTAHVARIHKSLIKKEIVIYNDGETIFLNPLYKLWLGEPRYR